MRRLLYFVPLALVACEEPFPEARTREYGSFGNEVYAMLHDEFLWSGTVDQGTARATAFSQHKDDVVWALDALAAGKVDSGMLPLLEEFLPLYGDPATSVPELIPQMTRDTAKILDELVNDRPALEAIAAYGAAVEANPGAVEHLLGTLARHPMQLMDPMVDMTLDLEPQLTELFKWLHRELPTLEEGYVERSDEKTFFQRLLDVTIEGGAEVIGPPTMSARLDGRGAPIVAKLPDGSWPAPFVDGDGDGQIDVDVYARPIDASLVPIDMPTFAPEPHGDETRDALGRAVVTDGQGQPQLLFEYFDLRQSIAAYLMRDGRKLMADGIQYDLFTAFEAMLGGGLTKTDADGEFTAYDVKNGALLDLVFALNELRRYDRLVPLIRVMEHLATSRENLLRQLTVDFAKARRIFEDAPSLTANNTMLEDLHPVLADMAQAGIFRDLFEAATDPRSATMFDGLVTKMKFTGLTPNDTSLLQIPEDVDDMVFVDPTPWGTPDTEDSQRSWLQKATLLMAETSGAPVIMRFLDRIDVPEVQITNDMAIFYVSAIAGVCFLDFPPNQDDLEAVALTLVHEFDPDDFEAPGTPENHLAAEELNLFINHNQPDVGNPLGLTGAQVRNTYGKALLSMQTSGSLYSLQPWVELIVNRRDRADLFVSLFSVLAAHYSETAYTSSNGDGEIVFRSHGTGFRRIEPYLVRVFEETDLGDHLQDLQVWSHEETVAIDGEQVNVADELDRFLVWMLDPDAGITLRSGVTSIPSRRGGVIEKPSRLQILMNAFDNIDAALSASPMAREAWDRIDLLGVFLDMNEAGTDLANLHALDVLVKLIPILADQAAEAVTQPDWQESIDTLLPDLEDAMGSRGFAALIDVMRKIRDTPRHRAFLDEMLAVQMAEEPVAADADVFGATLQVLATLGQMRIPFDAGTRMLHFVGNILDPADRLIFKPMETMKAMRAVDEERVTTELMLNLLAEERAGRTAIGELGSAFKAVLRPDTGATGVYSADDLFVVFSKMRDWMNDGERGAERLYKVIRNR